MDGIGALLTVNGDNLSGSDTLNVDDTGNTNGNTGNLTSTSIANLDMGGSITYGTIEELNIGLGSAGDVFTVESTHLGETSLESNGGSDVINIRTIAGVTNVDSGNDSDTINVGSNGNLDGVGALLTIDGNSPASGSDVLIVDDTGDMTPNNGTLTATTIVGLSSAGITYTAIEHLIISLGDGGNTFTINSTHGAATSGFVEDTIVNTGDRADTIVIKDVTDILVVNGEAGADTMTVNGTSVNSLVTLNGDAGNDIFNVRAMDGTVNVNGGADNDTTNVGSNADDLPGAPTNQVGNVDAINGLLTVNGGVGNDVLNVDDSNPLNEAKAGALTEATIRGLGLERLIDYQGLELLNIWLAGGNNVFTIDSTHDGETNVNTAQGEDIIDINNASGQLTVNAEAQNDIINVRGTHVASVVRINGEEGADTINLSNNSPMLPDDYPATLPPPAADTEGNIDNINGLVVIDGGLDDDTVNIDDSANTKDKSGKLTADSLRGLELEAGVDYFEAEDLNIWLGTGTDTFYIDRTHTGTTQLYAGDGKSTTNQRDDTIAIRSISGVTTIHGQAGNDGILVNVKCDSGLPLLVGTEAIRTTSR
jgi:hypothetical protein